MSESKSEQIARGLAVAQTVDLSIVDAPVDHEPPTLESLQEELDELRERHARLLEWIAGLGFHNFPWELLDEERDQ
jgi:hypothetical protein